MRILALFLALLANPLSAHELWLEPQAYQLAPESMVKANIVNGQEFKGTVLPFLPQRFVHFVGFANGASKAVPGRAGDTPALNMEPVSEGLNVFAYQATNATISYDNWEKFQKFVDHKDLGNPLESHQARGLPMEGFTEVYSRYSKTLVGVGNSAGSDFRTGLLTEIVALTNPYTDDISGGMKVQLFYGNDVRADEQIEVFEKAPDMSVTITLYRTDADGVATFPVKPGHAYMADAVVLREPSAELATNMNVEWETLWANLTFAVPE